MVNPRLFISHSSSDNVPATALHDALADLFDVFLDVEGIEGGEEWRRKIEVHLIECDAALVLLSVNAEQSDWVAAEAEMLGFRRRNTDKSLFLLPVLLDGFDAERLRRGRFEPSAIAEIQGLPLSSENPDVDEIVSRLRPVAEQLTAARLVLRDVESYLAAKIEEMNTTCQDAITELIGIKTRHQRLYVNRWRWLACKLLRVRDIRTFTKVILTVNRLATKELALELLDNLAPYCWVDPEVARELALQVLTDQRPKPGVGLLARQPETPDACVKRASESAIQPWKLWQCNPAWDDEGVLEYLIAEVMSSLHENAIVGADVTEPTDQVRDSLEEFAEMFGEVVVLLPEEFADQDDELFASLRETFRHVTFLLGTSEERPELCERFSDFKFLPCLDSAIETSACSKIRMARAQIDPKPKKPSQENSS